MAIIKVSVTKQNNVHPQPIKLANMKNHIVKHKHHYIRGGLLFCLLIVAYFVTITMKQHDVSYALTYDSHATILVTGDYQGSTSATSSQHSFGTCSSQVGQLFTIQAGMYTTCDGVAFGDPDGVVVYVPTAPTGFYVANWRVTGNTTNGSVSCSTTKCVLNYTAGTANLEVDINATTPPTAPTISVGGNTASSVTFNWTAGSAGSATFYNYLPYYNGATGPSTLARSFNWTGLSCGQTVSMKVAIRTSAGNWPSNTVSGTAAACATAPPPTTPTPTPTTTPSPQPTVNPSTPTNKTPLRVNQNTVAPGTVVEPAPVANEPPARPKNFRADPSGAGSAIKLSWDSDVNAISHKLERSTDNVTWKTLDGEISDDSYTDSATNFDTVYYYRLTAIDDTAQQSEVALAQTRSDKFRANAGTNKDLVLTSPDRALELTIPAKALANPASCSFAAQPTLPLYSLAKYEEAYGPYQLICQQADNGVINSFQEPLSAKLTFSPAVSKKYTKYALAGFDSSDQSWHGFSVAANAQPPVISFKMASSFTGLTIQGQPKRTPVIVVVLAVLGGLVTTAGLGLLGLRKVAQVQAVRRAEAINEDYWHKMNGV